MRRGPARGRAAGVAGPVAAALLLGGCGIQETDVIEAGGPASVQAFVNPGYDALLFFRAPDGALSPVSRSVTESSGFGAGYEEPDGPTEPVSTEQAIAALLSGPGPAERSAGLGTSLPRVTAGGVGVVTSPDADVTVSLPLALGGLDGTALRQLVCTAAYSQDRDGRTTVRMVGKDGVTATGTCGLDIAAEPAPIAVGTHAPRGRAAGTG
ncbi:hypothetical protein [Streptomyces glaucescens]|uniref:Lipoprotein n=1 Tax=Streptomyces glaucescens TaxID=1907 RepID=A0A089XCC7_STRGA|nr:hypothetical protein [Streptomyces glaucescens]AIS01648.1 hypothetical protein SGLAU_28560 [Streptomyces glaucescens]